MLRRFLSRSEDFERHLPILLIAAMLLIAIGLELTRVPPLAWEVKLPLAFLLGLYVQRVAAGDSDS